MPCGAPPDMPEHRPDLRTALGLGALYVSACRYALRLGAPDSEVRDYALGVVESVSVCGISAERGWGTEHPSLRASSPEGPTRPAPRLAA